MRIVVEIDTRTGIAKETGWFCPCGAFNGSEKEVRFECRCCGWSNSKSEAMYRCLLPQHDFKMTGIG